MSSKRLKLSIVDLTLCALLDSVEPWPWAFFSWCRVSVKKVMSFSLPGPLSKGIMAQDFVSLSALVLLHSFYNQWLWTVKSIIIIRHSEIINQNIHIKFSRNSLIHMIQNHETSEPSWIDSRVGIKFSCCILWYFWFINSTIQLVQPKATTFMNISPIHLKG